MFTLIAHRGACLEAPEDTLESLRLASELGADVVECDPRYTKDGTLVLFHDGDLSRLAKCPEKIADLTVDEVRERLASAGLPLTTLAELLAKYPASGAPVLMDGPENATDPEYYHFLTSASFRVIVGVHAPGEAAIAHKFFPGEQILAFMSKPELAAEFAEHCGILRLWEHWLTPNLTPATLKASLPGHEVWIMARDTTINHPLHCMNGSLESIRRMQSLGADGILLNDIRMAVGNR